MGKFVDSARMAFYAEGAIGRAELVKCGTAANQVAQCGLTDTPIGVAEEAAASGAEVTVKLLNSPGTVQIKTDGAVTKGAVVYTQASGCCDDSSASSAVQVGIAMEAATASGDIIEVLPRP